jgi:hypothetical protein
MTPVQAYQCDQTRRIFKTEAEARRSEFFSLMRLASHRLPSMSNGPHCSARASEILEWLATKLEGDVYPSALPELLKALQYLQAQKDPMWGETITCAALRRDFLIVSLPRPTRHHDVIRELDAVRDGAAHGAEQGFITSTGRFVDRKQALAIATAAGQITTKHGNPDELYSEDVWSEDAW